MRMRDTGEVGARVNLRDAMRGQAAKVSARVDQVALGTVIEVLSDARARVTFDGSRHAAVVGWAYPCRAAVGQRAVLTGLAGSQEWWVVAVVNRVPIDDLAERVTDLEARVTVLEGP